MFEGVCGVGWRFGGMFVEGGGGLLTSLGRIDVGVCYTRGARSRRWRGWWGRRGRWGRGWVGNCNSGMDGSKTITRRHPERGSVYYSGGFGY